MYKITHLDEDIDWVNGPDKPGSENTVLRPEECGDVLNNKAIYKMVGGACLLRDDADDILAAQEAGAAEAVVREDEIEVAQETSGLRQYTVEQATNWIDAQYDPAGLDAALVALNNATTVNEIKAEMINTFNEVRNLLVASKRVDMKMAPYVLQ